MTATGAGGGQSPAARFCARIEALTVRIAAGALALMVVLTTADALGRYFLNAPIDGAIEITNEFLMPALVFFTMSYVFARGGHVRVTLLSDRLSADVQRVLMVIFDIATTLFFAALTWGVARRTVESFVMREYSSSPLGYLIAPSLAIVAIGGALMTVRVALAALSARHPATAHSSDLESY